MRDDDQMADLEPAADDANNGLGGEKLPAIDRKLIIAGELALVPAFIAAGGQKAGFAFIDFFTAQIRNRNTRAAYAVAVRPSPRSSAPSSRAGSPTVAPRRSSSGPRG
jgi:hypothetical protein